MSVAALQLLLPKVLRRMVSLVVNVDVSTLNVRQRLNFDLQGFGAVVGLFDGLARTVSRERIMGEWVMAMYVKCCSMAVSAVTPIKSWNSWYAVLNHRQMIRDDSRIAPMGSIHHRTLAPRTANARPGPLMNRSFLWSSQRMRIWLYVLRRA
jgi:hypothetical protein